MSGLTAKEIARAREKMRAAPQYRVLLVHPRDAAEYERQTGNSVKLAKTPLGTVGLVYEREA